MSKIDNKKLELAIGFSDEFESFFDVKLNKDGLYKLYDMTFRFQKETIEEAFDIIKLRYNDEKEAFSKWGGVCHNLEKKYFEEFDDDSWMNRLWEWAEKSGDRIGIDFDEDGYICSFPNEKSELLKLTKPDIAVRDGYDKLTFEYCKLSVLPKEIGNLIGITSLHLNGHNLSILPKEIGSLTNLTSLDLCDNQLTELPKEIVNITNLTWLCLANNSNLVITTQQKEWIKDIKRNGHEVAMDDFLFEQISYKTTDKSNLADTINNQKVWLDTDTNLMWQMEINGNKYSLVDALIYANGLNSIKYGGYNDWRVPTLEELESLVTGDEENKLSYKCSNGYETPIKKPLVESMIMVGNDDGFWSSSKVESSYDQYERCYMDAYIVNFTTEVYYRVRTAQCVDLSHTFAGSRDEVNFIRCVRGNRYEAE